MYFYIKILAASVVVIGLLLALVWTTNFAGLKERIYVSQIVKLRVSPKRLENVKNPSDYGMSYQDVDIMTPDNIRLSAWEIPAPMASDKTIIVNHPLTTTRYGSTEGLDGVTAEFLPMVKHLHTAGYNVVMYDHRGQGDSDGGIGKNAQGTEAPVGVGTTEWQDVIGSLNYVKAHADFGDDEIAFLSQCMGANATFKAWRKAPKLFADPQIKALVANQPTVSLNMISRFIKIKTGMDLAEAVETEQEKQFGFRFADTLKDAQSMTVPVLFAQVRKDQYTYDTETGKNDIELIYNLTPTEKEMIWIGEEKGKPFGKEQRFDAYQYFNKYPEQMLAFLEAKFN